MKRFVLAAVLVAMAVPVFGQGIMERVDLPTAEREQMFWTTVVTDGSRESNRLVIMLRDPALRQLLQDTRYKPRTTADVFYREKLQLVVGNAPLFMVQDPDGAVVYKRAAGNIPSNASTLVRELKRELTAFRCQPKPDPAPPVEPPNLPVKPVIPDTEPVEPEGESFLLHAILVALGLAGGAAGGYVARSRR